MVRAALRLLWTLPRRLLMGAVRLYQVVLSPLFPPSCCFRPTCSTYALLALRRYGLVKGTILSVWRLLRCAPWGKGGYDPPRWFGEPAACAKAAAEPAAGPAAARAAGAPAAGNDAPGADPSRESPSHEHPPRNDLSR